MPGVGNDTLLKYLDEWLRGIDGGEVGSELVHSHTRRQLDVASALHPPDGDGGSERVRVWLEGRQKARGQQSEAGDFKRSL